MESKHPALAQEFKMGNFVVHKTKRDFSRLALDQAHEQANAAIKAAGRAIGLTENPSALRRWIVSGPEVNHLVSIYEMGAQTKEASNHSLHHEQTPNAQKKFLERVQELYQVLQDLGNPFQEDSADLFSTAPQRCSPSHLCSACSQSFAERSHTVPKLCEKLGR